MKKLIIALTVAIFLILGYTAYEDITSDQAARDSNRLGICSIYQFYTQKHTPMQQDIFFIMLEKEHGKEVLSLLIETVSLNIQYEQLKGGSLRNMINKECT